jgi:dipeptidase E
MKLLLTSAGLSTPTIRSKFVGLVGKEPKAISMAFIATASDVEKDKSYVEKDRAVFLKMGLKMVDVDLKNCNRESLKNQLQDIDVIFVEGGNTFYLLYWARKSGFDQILGNILLEGKVYFGASAGSILVGPSIEGSTWRGADDPSVAPLADHTGLNLVNFSVYPHYKPDQADFIKEKARTVPYEIVPLTDKQAISVDGSLREIV